MFQKCGAAYGFAGGPCILVCAFLCKTV